METVLKCRLSSGEVIEVHPYAFNKVNFKDAEIISGEKYYTDKAINLGAIKPRRKKKAE